MLSKVTSSVLIFFALISFSVFSQTLKIATVNNYDLLTLKELSKHFLNENPDISLDWTVLDENQLRQKVTTSVTKGSDEFDIVTLGIYEVQMWSKNQLLLPLKEFDDYYQLTDILPPLRYGLSWQGNLFALPFYAEGSMVMYRKDLLSKANLVMPQKPTWAFIKEAARAINDKKNGIHGICLRGKAGWGENMALITSMANSYGARWFDENWQPQFDSNEWRTSLIAYYSLLKLYGPDSASKNGFNENLQLFQQGKCGIWVDATVAGAMLVDTEKSKVASDIAFALAPHNELSKNSNWLWSWSLAIPVNSKHSVAANKFIRWATSTRYTELVAQQKGWTKVPPGTRKSLYRNIKYIKESPFSKITLAAIKSANSIRPTVEPVPYSGIQYVAIPEFQEIGTIVGNLFSATLEDKMTIREALSQAQTKTTKIMLESGYIQK